MDAAKAMKATANTSERTMCPVNASAHKIFLLNILNLLRTEALKADPGRPHFRADKLNDTLKDQSFFDALDCYLDEAAVFRGEIIV